MNTPASALIIANGTLPPRRLFRRFMVAGCLIVCADGGANHARRTGIRPGLILGDFDSVTPATLRHFRNTPQVRVTDQVSTDLEKAIRYCITLGIRRITIVGANGDRIDHVTGALGCFRKFGTKASLQFIDTVGTLFRIDRSAVIPCRKKQKFSLIPLGRCSGITTTNLKYPLKGESLEIGVREGISNFATASRVRIAAARGILLVYRFHGRP